MADHFDWLYDRRMTPPPPKDEVPCPECGQPEPYCLFRCPVHIANEAEYEAADDGEIACFICGWGKPEHHIGCYRAPDLGPYYRNTYTPEDF